MFSYVCTDINLQQFIFYVSNLSTYWCMRFDDSMGKNADSEDIFRIPFDIEDEFEPKPIIYNENLLSLDEMSIKVN